MKKLSVFELVLIPALVALTIIIKLSFASIPGVEFTTPLFVALVILLRRDLSLIYVIIFLLTDSLLLQKGNITFIGINALVWLSIYVLCQLVKTVKGEQVRIGLTFVTGFVAVLLQTTIWFYAFSIVSGTPILGFDLLLAAWAFDFVTWHPIVSGGFAVAIYGALTALTKASQFKAVFTNE